MRIKIYPYKPASESANILKQELTSGWMRNINGYVAPIPIIIKPTSPRQNPDSDVIINWGNSTLPQNFHWLDKDLNHPNAVKIATNKFLTFQRLQLTNIPTPEWTENHEMALDWAAAGHTVVVRHRVNAHSGEGISLFTPDDDIRGVELPDAPLYVKYKKKRSEYRVHVFNGRVIDVQEKRKQTDFDRNDLQSKIRSHSNGWVFCREYLSPYSTRLGEIATQAIAAIDLDFGAVDIIYNQREDTYYVLEVNTAVGLEGSTVRIYADAITEYVEGLQ